MYDPLYSNIQFLLSMYSVFWWCHFFPVRKGSIVPAVFIGGSGICLPLHCFQAFNGTSMQVAVMIHLGLTLKSSIEKYNQSRSSLVAIGFVFSPSVGQKGIYWTSGFLDSAWRVQINITVPSHLLEKTSRLLYFQSCFSLENWYNNLIRFFDLSTNRLNFSIFT
jgi:hypothetical protein